MPDPVTPALPWLAPWFQHPGRAELTTGHHLRPLRAADDGLRGLPAGLDLAGVVAACAARAGFVYGLFDDEERSVLGWVTLDPGVAPYDVEVGWTVGPGQATGRVADALAALLPTWVCGTWPWTNPLVTRR